MTVRPLVSIIIPAYNAESSLAQTLESVLSQTYDALEVLVVDDGSTDDTAAIAQRYARVDGRIRLLRQLNSGVVAARNRAIEESKGELIAPLDADDTWFKEKLTLQVHEFSSSGPEVGLVYCWSVHTDAGGQLTGHWCSGEVEGQVLKPLILRNFLGNASTPLISKAWLERVGLYDTSLRSKSAEAVADWDLYFRLAETCEFRVVPEFLVEYRQHEGNMSLNLEAMHAAYMILMASVRLRHPDYPAELFRWSEADFAFYLSLVGSKYGNDSRSGMQWLRRAIFLDPGFVLQPRFYRRLLGILAGGLSYAFTRNGVGIRGLNRSKTLGEMRGVVKRKRRFSLDPFDRRSKRLLQTRESNRLR